LPCRTPSRYPVRNHDQTADRTSKPAKEPATFREKVEAGRFVMTVEVDPPHGLGARKAIEGSKLAPPF